MPAKRKYEVHGEDPNGDIYIVGSDRKDSADAIAERFRKDGFKNVRIVVNN